MSHKYLFKYIIVGDTSVGKSCLLLKFTDNQFQQIHDLTIGVEFGTKIISVNNEKIKIQVWDTAGQELFRSITRSYYRGVAGVILVFDMSNIDSINSIPSWFKDLKNTYMRLSTEPLSIILVGNKIDKNIDNSIIENIRKKANQFAQENNIRFIETSAKSGKNVNELFTTLAKDILVKIHENPTLLQIEEENGVRKGSQNIIYNSSDKSKNRDCSLNRNCNLNTCC